MSNHIPLAVFALSTVCGCRSPVESTLAPVDATGEHDSPWAYIAARYDQDGDGRVTPAEHGRSEQGFGRLDHDGDGVLTVEDWQGANGGADLRGQMASRRARVALAMVLQLDDRPRELPRYELEGALIEFDTNTDRALDQAEFEAAATNGSGAGLDLSETGGMARMMIPSDPWEALLAAADQDGDGRLGERELLAFFDAHDGDQDGSWDLTALIPGARGTRDAGNGRSRSPVADSLLAQQGQVAPDFTLGSEDGGDEVTLSEFAGVRPVALVFGSYT